MELGKRVASTSMQRLNRNMSTVATPAKLLREPDALPFSELDKLVPRILALRVRKHPAVLLRTESKLIKLISAGSPARLVREYDRLIARREQQRLSVVEQNELERLVAEFDAYHLQHVAWLYGTRRASPDERGGIGALTWIEKDGEWPVAVRRCAGQWPDSRMGGASIAGPGGLCGQFVLPRTHPAESRERADAAGESRVCVSRLQCL